MHSGVHNGSLLGLIIFSMYTKHLSTFIDSHPIIHHSMVDGIQSQMSSPSVEISELLHSMLSCMRDVNAWTTAKMLRPN